MSGFAVCAGCGERFALPEKHPRQRFCSQRCGVKRGAENNRYNGGLCRRGDGRTVIYCRDGSLMMYSRAVMAAGLGRLPDLSEVVHHRNGDVTDDRAENLEVLTRAQHIGLHRGLLGHAV